MPSILILNGPNLNLLGQREPEVYGAQSFKEYLQEIKDAYFDVTIDYKQSNIEGELIDAIQQAKGKYDGVVFNPGGYTHTSVAIHDAIAAVELPVVEVHISNIFAREEFRHKSIISSVVAGSISGFGFEGYVMAIDYFLD